MNTAAKWTSRTLQEVGLPRTKNIDPANYADEIFELYSVPAYSTGEPDIIPGAEIGSTKQIVEPGDVLLCKIVPHLNRVWVVPPKQLHRQIASGEWIVLRSSEHDPSYIRRALMEPGFRDKFMETVSGVGGSLLRARPQLVSQIRIALAPASEQRRIVATLDRVLAKSKAAREELDRVPKLVDRYKQALLAAVFRGELPPGGTDRWPVKRLYDIADLQLGKMLDKGKNKGKPEQYLRNANVRWLDFDLSDLLTMSFTEDEKEKFSIRDGDIMICEGGEPGRAAVWRGGRAIIRYQKALHRVRAHKGVRPEWIVYQLYHAASTGALSLYFTGTTIKHLPKQALAEVPFLVPREDEQSKLIALIERDFHSINILATEAGRASALLDRVEQATLAKAFRGEFAQQEPNEESFSITSQDSAAKTRNVPPRPESFGNNSERDRVTKVAKGTEIAKKRTDVSENYLAESLRTLGGSADARSLWQHSGMEVEEFYKQLRDEIKAGCIQEGASKERLSLTNEA